MAFKNRTNHINIMYLLTHNKKSIKAQRFIIETNKKRVVEKKISRLLPLNLKQTWYDC